LNPFQLFSKGKYIKALAKFSTNISEVHLPPPVL